MVRAMASRLSWRARLWARIAAWWTALLLLVAVERSFFAGAPTQSNSDATAVPSPRGCAAAARDVARIAIAAGERRIAVERHGAHWQRGSEAVPADLVQAFFDALGTSSAWPRIGGDAMRDRDFGLHAPAAAVELQGAGGESLCQLAFGAANPVGTGRYARIDHRDGVFLAGIQVWYYLELLAGTPLDKSE